MNHERIPNRLILMAAAVVIGLAVAGANHTTSNTSPQTIPATGAAPTVDVD